MKKQSITFVCAVLLWAVPLFAQDRANPSARGAARGARGAPPGPKITGDYASDIIVVRDAQAQALEQVQGTENARDQAALETAIKEMERALAALQAATNSPGKLPDALAAEQAAYQAILKFSAREYQVSQSRGRGQRGQQSGNRAGQPNQRQLDQLELRQQENRYETQRQAAQQQSPQQREQLTVLNRLKELAQRQQDLNQRLKELQTALQEARTEAERADVRNELKRLRDEQREMLADVDELRQRMDRPENQSTMAEARQQLDQTRSEVQRAADALEKESVSQALSSATRAERELQQLRDDFRKQTSSQFTEEMRQMRDEARQLAQREEEIRKGIEERADPQRKALSDAGKTEALLNQIEQQRSTLTNLLAQMRDLSERTEAPEPLLSKQLYDTLRKASQGNTDNALTMTSELLKRSFAEQAGPFEQRARQDIDELKRGVEKAAESVLGDETESLRLAKRELDDLSQQLEREIARATGQGGQSTNAATASARGALDREGAGQTNRLSLASNEGERRGSASGRSGEPSEQARGSQQGQRGGERAGQQGDTAGAGQRGDQQGQLAQNANAQDGSRSGQSRSGQRGQNGGEQGNSEQAQSRRGDTATANAGGGQRGERNLDGPRQGGNFWDAGGARDTVGGAWYGGYYGPLTGTNYVDWYERLGNVEEMITAPELRSQVARIRDRARVFRDDLRRTGIQPKWPLVKVQVAEPLAEVRNRVAEELARRESVEALVPIDRDPVPTRYSELVRKYYETLGTGK